MGSQSSKNYESFSRSRSRFTTRSEIESEPNFSWDWDVISTRFHQDKEFLNSHYKEILEFKVKKSGF